MDNSKMIAGRFLRWHEARRKLAWVRAQIDAGRTVYLRTMTKATKVTARTVDCLQARRSGLHMVSGSRSVCVDYCRLESV